MGEDVRGCASVSPEAGQADEVRAEVADGAGVPEQDEMTTEELAVLCDQRASQYGLLARLYRVEVDRELLDELCGMRFPAQTGNDDIDRGYRLISTYLGAGHVDTLTELAVDYVRVFLGNGNDTYSAAFPFESVYTSEKRLTMQDARDEVLAIYRANGVGKQESWHEAEDHIACELEFMQVLATRTAQALRAGDEAQAGEGETAEERVANLLATQRDFLEKHLARWTPMLTADMRTFARTDFYQGLSWLTDGMLATDAALLSEAADPQD